MRRWKAPAVALYLTVLATVGGCSNGAYYSLPAGVTSVNVGLSLSGRQWKVSVRNQNGEASDTICAANDHRRSNLYLTPRKQLVIIEQGGGDVFFFLPENAPPESLSGARTTERDTESMKWRYIGVIKGDVLLSPAQMPECIALLGEGNSPYRREYQKPSFC